MTQYSVSLPHRQHAAVVVIGSGAAGATAAIAAARTGAQTLLIERYGFLGGTSTMVLDTFYGFYTPGATRQRVVGGLPWEVVERLRQTGYLIERPNSYGAGQGITYDPQLLTVVWEQLASEAGVTLALHTVVVDVLTSADRISGLVVANKAGLGLITGDLFIDTSGDADVCARAGAPYEDAAASGSVQSLTTTFSVANVDERRALAVTRAEFEARMRAANLSGEYHLPREEGSAHRTPMPGLIATNMTRVAAVDAIDPAALTAAELEGRRQAVEYARFLRDQIPGYEAAYLTRFSTQIGVRETRRVYGQYRLTRDDVLSARRFPDAIAQCGAPIEDHHAGRDTLWEYVPDGGTYDIPYGCLVPQRIGNLLFAGRCLSATHDAHASVRSMGQCMAMGQAVGTAAALALAAGVEPGALAIERLQTRLRADGALFGGALSA